MRRGAWSGWEPAGPDWPAPEETLEVVSDTDDKVMERRDRVDTEMADVGLPGQIEPRIVKLPFSE